MLDIQEIVMRCGKFLPKLDRMLFQILLSCIKNCTLFFSIAYYHTSLDHYVSMYVTMLITLNSANYVTKMQYVCQIFYHEEITSLLHMLLGLAIYVQFPLCAKIIKFYSNGID